MADQQDHLDEGTIHAWLDGALPPDESARAEAHVAACGRCSTAVAEARGLIAASSRILASLDDVPAGVIPGTAEVGDQLTVLRRRHATLRAPWWTRRPVLAAASVVLVAGMTTVVWVRTPEGERMTRPQIAASVPDESPAAQSEATAPPAPVAVAPERQEARAPVPTATRPASPPVADVAGAPAAGQRADVDAEAKRTVAARDSSANMAQKVATGAAAPAARERVPDSMAGETAVATAEGRRAVLPPAQAQSGQAVRQSFATSPTMGAARTLGLTDSVAPGQRVASESVALTNGFPAGCYELRGLSPVGSRLLGVPELVKLIGPPSTDALSDTTWKPATGSDEPSVRTTLVWRMIDSVTVELRVRRPLDSTVVAFRVAPVGAPLPPRLLRRDVQAVGATRVVCRSI